MPLSDGDPNDAELENALGWDETTDTESPDATAESLDVTVANVPSSPPPLTVSEPPREAEVGSDAVPPVVPSPVTPDPYRQQLEQREAQLRQQQATQQINQQAGQYMDGLIGQGWSDEQARTAATQYAQSQFATWQNGQLQAVAEEQAKIAKAHELSAQYGIPRDQLTAYNDPSGMEQAAKLYQETTGRIKALESKVNQGNLAPVQTFDSNSMTASGSKQAKKLAYATGKADLTDTEYAELFGT